MQRTRFVLTLAFILFFLSFFSLFPGAAAARVPEVVLVQKKATVTVVIYDGEKAVASGSGFIVDPSGIVVTNEHVVGARRDASGTRIEVYLEGGVAAEVDRLLVTDKKRDVALLKLKGGNFPAVSINPAARPALGDDVYVIGTPQGLPTTVSAGIISSIRGSDGILQITAPISPGSSGSPVFNANGEVIGMATLQFKEGQNLNFAVPYRYIEAALIASRRAEPRKSPPAVETASPADRQRLIGLVDGHIRKAIDLSGKNLSAAIDEVNRGIERMPDYAPAYLIRGIFYYGKIAHPTMPNPAPPAAGSKKREAWEKESREYRNVLARNKPLCDAALNDFNRAIELDPANDGAYSNRARIYATGSCNRQDLQRAVADFTTAIQLNPGKAVHYQGRGYTYKIMAAYGKSIADLRRAVSLNPDAHYSYFTLALVYDDMKKIDLAAENYVKALELVPRDKADLIERYGKTMEQSRKDNHPALLRDYTGLIAARPGIAFFYKRRAALYIAMAYLPDLSKLISLEPDNPEFYRMRGSLYLVVKRKTAALSDLRKACVMGLKKACNTYAITKKDLERGEQWVYVGYDKKNYCFYNAETVTRLDGDTVRFWMRTEPGGSRAIQDGKNVERSSGIGQDYNYALFLYEQDCTNSRYRLVSYTVYDDNERVIETYRPQKAKIDAVLPDTVGAEFYEIVCRGKKPNLELPLPWDRK
jgi:serine protease Do